VQSFGEGVLLGTLIPDSGDGRYFILKNDGQYLDLIGDWDTSPIAVGACVLPTVAGLKLELSYSGSPEEFIGCPLEPARIVTLSYQAAVGFSSYVTYIGTSDGDNVYRLSALSSRPETEGEWQAVR
jgi:hypothetical protein